LLQHGVRSICTSTSHFWTLPFLGSPLQGHFKPEPNIRLMVDVLLTMNEAFCNAGVKFPVPNRQTFSDGVARR
jgi:hypothetical protein